MARAQFKCRKCRVSHFALSKIGRRHRKFAGPAKRKPAKRKKPVRRKKPAKRKKPVRRRKPAKRKKPVRRRKPAKRKKPVRQKKRR